MNGTYYISASIDSDKQYTAGMTSIRVEEYRRPGFFVELKSNQEYYKLGDEVTLTGTVTSYSGMPMAGSEVKISITYRQPWWRYYSSVIGTYAATATTDAAGAFSLTLPTDRLAGTPLPKARLNSWQRPLPPPEKHRRATPLRSRSAIQPP